MTNEQKINFFEKCLTIFFSNASLYHCIVLGRCLQAHSTRSLQVHSTRFFVSTQHSIGTQQPYIGIQKIYIGERERERERERIILIIIKLDTYLEILLLKEVILKGNHRQRKIVIKRDIMKVSVNFKKSILNHKFNVHVHYLSNYYNLIFNF